MHAIYFLDWDAPAGGLHRKLKVNEPEPVIITVKELGMSGWINGER